MISEIFDPISSYFTFDIYDLFDFHNFMVFRWNSMSTSFQFSLSLTKISKYEPFCYHCFSFDQKYYIFQMSIIFIWIITFLSFD